MPNHLCNNRQRQGRPSSVRFADSFSLRAKSRLRRLLSDTRLRAQPLGGSQKERKPSRFALFLFPITRQELSRSLLFGVVDDLFRIALLHDHAAIHK